MKHLPLIAVLAASPAFSGVEEAANDYILPNLAKFSETARSLNELAQANCEAETLEDPFHTAFDAWMAISDIRIGPSEHAALSISFWPDKRGFTEKTLSRYIAEEDPIVADQVAFQEASIAARGFFALERMLYDPDFNDYAEGDYSCALTRALTRDLAVQAFNLQAEWADFAPTLLNPGAEGNATYLDASEAQRAIYTQLLATLEFTTATRLGRPLGEPARPRPTRAEAWRSERSLRQSLLATEAAVDLAHALANSDLPETDAALAAAREQADTITDPSFQDIEDLTKRLNLELLQQRIEAVEHAIEVEVGARFGIAPGFNSSDGD
ncbi:imelysin family protein [Maritimibacter sp. UBA3975]|uniref:imelysin family protein n=1 Tax=Maritimibacter sp. UBA3975 TaxID=1946833 RepID=UPI000C08EEFE|nr:imelysin family protein [Maritimibacter sp. UBA3975]MAM63516.1 signal peptidase [Maritimibacter sp.]